MERLAAVWNSAPLWVGLAAIIVLVFVIAWFRRSRTPQVPIRKAEPHPAQTNDDIVDSSHIGFAPLVGSTGNQVHFDADGPAGGDDARRGSR